MFSRIRHLIALAITLGISVCCADTTNLNAGETDSGPTTTSISGVLRYEADSKRPWRFGRYYIKGKEKHLAEAVVELIPASKDIEFPKETDRESKTYLMDQENFMFVPETLAVQLGDKVRFKNSEEAFHNVMCLDDKPPFNINLAKGQEHVHEPKVADGTQKPLDIRCVFHGSMKGWLFVVPHRHFKLTDASGAFKFTGFPPGKYQLRVAHPAGELFLETEPRQIESGSSVEWNLTLSPDHLKQQKK